MSKVGNKSGIAPYWQQGPHRLYQGDCLEVMAKLRSLSVDLAFVDPPFNIDYDYDQYDDKLDGVTYLDWTRRWLRSVYRLLRPAASLYVAIGLKYQVEIKIAAEEVGFHWRDTLCWHYTFGPRQESKFTPSWVAIHYFSKHPKEWTWNKEAVRVPSARQLKYGDKRAVAGGKLPDNTWILLPGEYAGCFQEGDNALLESRVAGTFKERTAHPCQMPEAVLRRIIRASSNPGDTVLDPMVGSGTTAAVAIQEGRVALGIELSEPYLRDIVVPRLTTIPQETL